MSQIPEAEGSSSSSRSTLRSSISFIPFPQLILLTVLSFFGLEDFYDPMPVDEFEDGLGRSLYQSQISFNREGNSGQGAYMADESILQGNLHKGGHKHGQNTDKIVDQDFFNGKFDECLLELSKYK